MAKSKDTKKALALSFKEQLTHTPYSKISVERICNPCGIGRKSFYYHFKDKDDLVIWIFDTELAAVSNAEDVCCCASDIERLLRYLYNNKGFYKRVLKSDAEYPFAKHLRSHIVSVISQGLESFTAAEPATSLQIAFLADGIICTVKRWLCEPQSTSPEELFRQLRLIARGI